MSYIGSIKHIWSHWCLQDREKAKTRNLTGRPYAGLLLGMSHDMTTQRLLNIRFLPRDDSAERGDATVNRL